MKKYMLLKRCLLTVSMIGMFMASTVHVQCTEGKFYSSSEIEQMVQDIRKKYEDAGYTFGHFGSGSGQTNNSQDTSNQEKANQVKSCEHDYVETITKEATCAENGEMVSKCSKCGDSYKTVIPATGKHDYVSETTKEATCTEAQCH
ncbi:POTRA domain-containing protein [Butyrivibrio proteoclasticus]|uniref:POTRA domain-containing protein n=1 Tax=Butyrivibrio proteoclasticus TaxID=43305 RepID=UPI00047EB093|nr:POTRA domain-containing protein [Butyrivibrio proteoclasticus]